MPDRAPILIVQARFYEAIAEELLKGAVAVLEGEEFAYETVSVPGVFEIPAAVAMAESSRREFAGYIALGCVIRGETSHYDYVCGESARGLQTLACDNGLAIGYGILTTENRDQAWARAACDKGNKGAGAARACIEMVRLKSRFGGA